MSRSLSNLVDNLSEGLHNDKCIDCKSCLDYMITKDDQLIFRCFECKRNYNKDFNKEPDKEPFYSSLNMEDIIDVDHKHAERAFKSLNNKNLGDSRDLYAQSGTLFLADIFENFRNKCIEMYELDPAHLFICTRISMASMFKENRGKARIVN